MVRTAKLMFGFMIGLAATAVSADVPAAHDAIRCDACHAAAGAELRADVPANRSRGRGACVSCHGGDEGRSASFHRGGRCTDCHLFHATDEIRAGDRRFPRPESPTLVREHCDSCHHPDGDLQRISDGHREAAAVYHVPPAELAGLGPSGACLRCHSRDGAEGTPSLPAPRFAEHASHPYGVVVRPGAGDSTNHIRYEIDPRIPLFDGRMECSSCHRLAHGTEDDLVPFSDPYAMCLGCHAQEARPRDRLASLSR